MWRVGCIYEGGGMHVWMGAYVKGLKDINKRIEDMIKQMEQGSQKPSVINKKNPDDETENDTDLKGLIRIFTDSVHSFKAITDAVKSRKCSTVGIKDFRIQFQGEFDLLYQMSEINRWTPKKFREIMGDEFVTSGTYESQWDVLFDRLWPEWISNHA